MTDTITIPLYRLAPWDGNVRKTGIHEGIAELSASIAAHGLLQSLVVRKGKRGKYEIVAGQRRFLALTALAKNGAITKDHPVPCMLTDDGIDASELSLAENVVRAPMHPADQFEAFRTLIDGGATVADVAARFGVAETIVAKRLKLGRLSPVVLEAYRNDEIDLEQAQAFTVSDDHAAQERVLGELSSWNDQPHVIRRMLTEDEVATTDKRVRFVGIEAYRAAGGILRQDLFSGDDAGYIVDVALLDRLVTEKLKTVAADVAAEGWLWVETASELDHEALSRLARRYPEQADLPDDEQAELDALAEAYDALVDSDDDSNTERLAEVEVRMDALNAKTEVWSADTLRIAGALVTLGYDGEVRIERGLVRKTDLPLTDSAVPGGAKAVDPVGRSGLSDRLVEDLTAEKSAAIGAALMEYPEVALAAVVHALALDLLYPGEGTTTCLKLRVTPPGLRQSIGKPDASKGLAVLAAEKDRLGDHLPGNPRDLWAWCLARSQGELLSLLAFVAGSAVDAVQRKADRPGTQRLEQANRLTEALSLDMTAWYVPTAEGYFARISRSDILVAIDEAKGEHAPSLEKLKKSELASRAEQLVSGTGWLPRPLRIEAVRDDASSDDEINETLD